MPTYALPPHMISCTSRARQAYLRADQPLGEKTGNIIYAIQALERLSFDCNTRTRLTTCS